MKVLYDRIAIAYGNRCVCVCVCVCAWEIEWHDIMAKRIPYKTRVLPFNKRIIIFIPCSMPEYVFDCGDVDGGYGISYIGGFEYPIPKHCIQYHHLIVLSHPKHCCSSKILMKELTANG